MHDTDKPNGAAPPSSPFVTSAIKFLHPPGFEVAGFLCVAIDKNGQPFTNAPPDPSMCLHLAGIAIRYAMEMSIKAMEAAKQPSSPIVAVPAGLQIPTWRGPAGRG